MYRNINNKSYDAKLLDRQFKVGTQFKYYIMNSNTYLLYIRRYWIHMMFYIVINVKPGFIYISGG